MPDENVRTSPSSVVVIVLDDVGFSHLGCYGSDIHTPAIDALAANGIRYTNFHATPLCSPSRAALLTGRNHHSVGMGIICEYATSHPGYRGLISQRAATVAEVLQQENVNTMAVGKWHVLPSHETGPAGPFTHWPTGRGFNHFYGFLGAETSQWHPDLVEGNERRVPPEEAGYHLSEDLVDHAVRYVSEHRAVAPTQPYLLYLAFGAAHAPHHAPADFISKYAGAFDDGWDAARERVFARQLAAGIVPAGTRLPGRNPGVVAWADLDPEERRLFARMQEVFAGYLEHTDAQIQRLIDFLAADGQLENTLIMVTSDNGASGEGGPVGTSELYSHIGKPGSVPEMLEAVDDLGSAALHNHYPQGWAQVGNTPLRWYKRQTYGGGIRDPLVVHWPAGFAARGELRTQYHHLIDVTPTILDVMKVEAPTVYKGVQQMPVEGVSLGYSFSDASAPTRRPHQYYEMLGNRAMWADGWKAVAYHEPGSDFDDDEWELYNVDEDFSETNDLASSRPEMLKHLTDLWWSEAAAHNVLPLDDSFIGRRFLGFRKSECDSVTLWNGAYVPAWFAPGDRNIPAEVSAYVERSSPQESGVLIALGGAWIGYTLYVKDNHLVFEYHYYGEVDFALTSREAVPVGSHVFGFRCEHHRSGGATVTLLVDGEAVGSGSIERIVPFAVSGIEAMEVGRDRLTPVSKQYSSPFAFSGRLERVVVKAGPMSRGPSQIEIEGAFEAQ